MDWSGDATEAGQRRRIVMASWRKGEVTIASGFTREEAGTRLLAEAASNPSLIVGLDFAFSFPAWWVRAQGCADVFALWALASSEGERWLAGGRPPFWGRPGQPRPARASCAGLAWIPPYRIACRRLRLRHPAQVPLPDWRSGRRWHRLRPRHAPANTFTQSGLSHLAVSKAGTAVGDGNLPPPVYWTRGQD